ncbi:MAG TPA: hypothetical protein VJI33_04325 [Candidatus Paceibacterota bacterium]
MENSFDGLNEEERINKYGYLSRVKKEEIPLKIQDRKDKIKYAIEHSLAEFVKLYKDPKTGSSTVYTISEALRNPELGPELESFTPKGKFPISKNILPVVMGLAEKGELPLDLWKKILIHNQRSLEKKEKYFNEHILPELKAKLLEAVQNFSKHDLLPFTVDQVRQVMEGIHFSIKDPTAAYLENNAGSYNPNSNTVLISSSIIESHVGAVEEEQKKELSARAEELLEEIFGTPKRTEQEKKIEEENLKFKKQYPFHIFTHEVLHVLSGKTIVKVTPEKDDEMESFVHRKVGLGHPGARGVRFKWLNEAVTEYLTCELTGDKDRKFVGYKKEMELFDLLRKSGKVKIPADIFIAAYFENFDPALSEEKRLENWKSLRQKLAEAYDHDYIVKLDRDIQEKGLDYAINSLKGNA